MRKAEYKFLVHPPNMISIAHWQGKLAQRPAQGSYTLLEYVLSFCEAVVLLIGLVLPPLSPRALLQCKVSTGAQQGQCCIIPALGFLYYVPIFRNVIIRYQCRELLQAQKEHPECRCVGLGMCNKLETLNGGGEELVRRLGSKLTVSVAHGNTLTAAACVQ